MARPIFVPLQVQRVPSRPRGVPLFRLGFRPFYLGGALVAAITVPLWVAMHHGTTSLTPAIAPLYWHAHEMLFGFAAAIIVGFLLTAGRHWTNLQTPRGLPLAALVALWFAARVAAFTGPVWLFALCDSALLPIVAVVLIVLFVRARSFHNLPLAAIVLLLAAANIAFHATVLEMLSISALTPLWCALALITVIEVVIAGRIVPSFMMAACRGVTIVPFALLDSATIVLTLIAFAAWLVGAPASVAAPSAFGAALLHCARVIRWKPWAAWGNPILISLHVAYIWIPVGLVLLGLSSLGIVAASSGIHALAVGATGGLIIAMITRTVRGHTGRPIRASAPEALAYSLVFIAAAVRVFLPMVDPALSRVSLWTAAALWCAAFAIFLVVCGPWIVRARLDGVDG